MYTKQNTTTFSVAFCHWQSHTAGTQLCLKRHPNLAVCLWRFPKPATPFRILAVLLIDLPPTKYSTSKATSSGVADSR